MKAPRVLAFVMAGGEGRRLRPLTVTLPKPALPFGSRHRIIDFVLSNLHNSGIRNTYVLLQYRPEVLLEHLAESWIPLSTSNGCHLSALLPQSLPGRVRFLGTADSVRRCMHLIDRHAPDVVAVFAADHVYRMDVQQMICFHRDHAAAVTVSAVPVPLAAARDFGIIVADEHQRIVAFEEKSERPTAMVGHPESAYASMGNYLFEPDVLKSALREAAARNEHDFGRDVLPRLIRTAHVYAYNFAENRIPGATSGRGGAYWRDVGSIDAYVAAHRETLGRHPVFALDNSRWPILPSSAGNESVIEHAPNCVFGPGVVAHRALVRSSVLHRNTHLEPGVEVANSVLMGDVRVRRGAKLKNTVVGPGNVISGDVSIGYDIAADRSRFLVTASGTVVVPPGTLFAGSGAAYAST